MTILVHRTYIKPSHPLFSECDFLCYVTKNLYNHALYQIRNYGFLEDDHRFSADPSIQAERKLLQQEKLKSKRANDKAKIEKEPDSPRVYFNPSFFLGEKPGKKEGIVKKRYAFEATELYFAVKHSVEFQTKSHPEYLGRVINTKILKQTIRQVSQDFSNFYASVKEYGKNPSGFLGRPELPGYKRKGLNGRTVCTVPVEAISVNNKKNTLSFGGTQIVLDLSLIKDSDGTVLSKDRLLEAKIVPCSVGYDILISYLDADTSREDYKKLKKEKKETKKTSKTKEKLLSEKQNNQKLFLALQETLKNEGKEFLVAGCDLGVNNIAALSSNNPSILPLVVNGRAIKSINQFYNKSVAFEKSSLSQKTNGAQLTSLAIQKLHQKRHHKMTTELHRVSKFIVDWLLAHGISCLVIGKNDNWKQNVNLGRKTNQSFVNIPHARLISMIQYKCARVGVFGLDRGRELHVKVFFSRPRSTKKPFIYGDG